MALVRTVKRITKDRQRVHEDTDCLASVFTDEKGVRYIQLDTYGSRGRKVPGKVSQAMQFNEASAHQLKGLIEEIFPEGLVTPS